VLQSIIQGGATALCTIADEFAENFASWYTDFLKENSYQSTDIILFP